MTDANKSHITLVVDRTGSMSDIRSDAEGAVNAFIEKQKALPNPCTMLLVEFDAPGSERWSTVPWYHIVHDGDLQTTPTYHLEPRGNTALFDAMGQSITATGERLAALPENERPGHVFVVIQTDGQENASKDWKLDKLIEAIKRQENDYKWEFIFLGTGLDAFSQSRAFVGTRMAGTHTVGGSGTQDAYYASYSFVSDNVANTRSGKDVDWKNTKVDDEGNVVQDEDAKS